MENFFYNDNYYHDLSSLLDDLDLHETEDVEKLPDDYELEAEETTNEKIFELTLDFCTDAIVDRADAWEERFPEDSDDIYDRIKKAVKESINIEKLNSLLPTLNYANGTKFKITKNDLLEYVK